MRVTDLEEFAESEIMQPYWPGHPDHQKPEGRDYESYREMLTRTGQRRYSLERVTDELRKHEDSEWFRMVINRLGCIGIVFPAYVQHPLVSDMRRYLDRWRSEKND
ncbi:hypothetical protein [Nesterenkonia suensis]